MFLSNQLKLFVYYIILFYWSIVDLQCILFSDVQQSDSVMCVYTHTHTYVYIHTHTCTYIYIHFFRFQAETFNVIAIIILNAFLETSGSFNILLIPKMNSGTGRIFLVYFFLFPLCSWPRPSAGKLVSLLLSLALFYPRNMRLGGGWALNSSAWSWKALGLCFVLKFL